MKKAILCSLLLTVCFFGKAQVKNFLDQPYIELSAVADTLIVPDMIYIRINISESDTKGKQSVEDLEIKMVNALRSLNINTEKDLFASDMVSNFRTYFLKGKEVLKSKQYSLLVHDAVTAGKVFAVLESNNIANTGIEKTEHSNIENIKLLLRSKAILNAKAKAEALTRPINQTIGAAVNITDIDMSNNSMQASATRINIRGYSSLGDAPSVEPPKIEFEKIRLLTSVNVKFLLK